MTYRDATVAFNSFVARAARETDATILNSLLPVVEEGTKATLLTFKSVSLCLRLCKLAVVLRCNEDAELFVFAILTVLDAADAAAARRVAWVTAACLAMTVCKDFLRRKSDKN